LKEQGEKAMKKDKKNTKKKKKLRIKELEKKVTPSPGKKPIPPPYTPGTLYGLAKRSNVAL
jgi:hypothetical protein